MGVVVANKIDLETRIAVGP